MNTKIFLSVILVLALASSVFAQTITVNPYARLIPLCAYIDTVDAADSITFYIPANMEFVRMNIVAAAVDTGAASPCAVTCSLKTQNAGGTITGTAITNCTIATQSTVVTGAPSSRTVWSAGEYKKLIFGVGTSDKAINVWVTLWCLLR